MKSLKDRVLIRDALPTDDRAIGDLLVDAYVVRYADKMPWVVVTEERKADLRDVAAKRGQAKVLVAELEGRVIGTVALYPPGSTQSQAWLPNAYDLRHLAVSVDFHGHGLSAPLLDIAESWVWSQANGERVCLHVRKGNQGVAALYRARGYQRDPSGDREYPGVSLEAYFLKKITSSS